MKRKKKKKKNRKRIAREDNDDQGLHLFEIKPEKEKYTIGNDAISLFRVKNSLVKRYWFFCLEWKIKN